MLHTAATVVDYVGDAGVIFAAGVSLLVLLAAIGKLIAWGYRIAKIIEKELTHNGGNSVKDYARDAKDGLEAVHKTTETLQRQQERTHEEVGKLTTAQHGFSRVLDNLVARKELEHDEIWAALVTLGVDRRRPQVEET